MRSAFVALMALAAVAVPAQASSPDDKITATVAPSAADEQALRLARAFVEMTSPPDIVEKQFIDQLKAMVLVMPGQNIASGSVEEVELNETLSAARPAVRRHLPAVAEAAAQAYARNYSAEELQQLIVFVSSPVGKRYVSETAITLDPAVTAAGKLLMEDAGGP